MKNQRRTLISTGKTGSPCHLPQHPLGQVFNPSCWWECRAPTAAVITLKNEKQQPLPMEVGGLKLGRPSFCFHFLISLGEQNCLWDLTSRRLILLLCKVGNTSLMAQWQRIACLEGDAGSIPGSGKSPGEGNGNALQYSSLGESHGQRSLAGYSP